MKRHRLLGSVFLVSLLAACSTARIAVPPALAATAEPIEISGMGFGQRGNFRIGQSSGSFVRQALSADERDWFPGQVTSFFGDSRFTAQGADFDGTVEGDCRHLEVERSGGSLTLTEVPFHYRCNFARNGRPIAARLILHAAPRPVGPLTAETRIGHFDFGGRRIDIQPIHRSPGMLIATAEPLGYRFIRDGRDVGAVDLNGERKTIYAPRAGADREAVLIGSLALSVLWRS